MSKSHPVGSLEHAMSYAVQCLGVETVAGICGRSPSAIYRGINPDDPLSLSWLTVEHVRNLGQALLGRNKPEFFSSAVRQQIETEALFNGLVLEISESPMMTLAEASEQLSRALRMVAGSLGRGDQPETLRVEQTLMIVEALENAVSYAKRAKLAVLRRTQDAQTQLEDDIQPVPRQGEAKPGQRHSKDSNRNPAGARARPTPENRAKQTRG